MSKARVLKKQKKKQEQLRKQCEKIVKIALSKRPSEYKAKFCIAQYLGFLGMCKKETTGVIACLK